MVRMVLLIAGSGRDRESQKHSGAILSFTTGGFKRVGLHYIGFSWISASKQNTCPDSEIKNRQFPRLSDELGLELSSRRLGLDNGRHVLSLVPSFVSYQDNSPQNTPCIKQRLRASTGKRVCYDCQSVRDASGPRKG